MRRDFPAFLLGRSNRYFGKEKSRGYLRSRIITSRLEDLLLGMSNLSLRSILDTCKLTGPNFLDWERNVRLVLRQENIEYVLDTPVPKIPDANSPEFATFDLTDREKHVTDAKTVQCVMLAAMSTELQRQHDRMSAFEMLEHLKSLFDSESQTLEYELLTDIFKCRLQEGGNV
ncbi:unnamed protein product, partial [Cuscuta europaea]